MPSPEDVSAVAIRRIVLEQSKRAHVGHIGSCLSVADILAALYGGAMKIDDPDDPDRDRFVMSKGHAALALYAALHLRGWLEAEELDTFCGGPSRLGVHPEHVVPGIDFSTGSLGQGLTFGAGAALAARTQGSARRVFVLMSDAECNEGSVWEAAMFAAHHRLWNLVVVIDDNGQQALGRTCDVLDLSPLAERWRAFGWRVEVVDGNDVEAVHQAADSGHDRSGVYPQSNGNGHDHDHDHDHDADPRPRVVVARTTFGKGVSFMEHQLRWHYMPMSDAEYAQAMGEVQAQPCAQPSFAL